jgi:hypothetical protein
MKSWLGFAMRIFHVVSSKVQRSRSSRSELLVTLLNHFWELPSRRLKIDDTKIQAGIRRPCSSSHCHLLFYFDANIFEETQFRVVDSRVFRLPKLSWMDSFYLTALTYPQIGAPRSSTISMKER